MALFEIRRRSSLEPAEAWRRLTAWERHSRSVPLTRMTVLTPPPTGWGTVVLARTGAGPLGFDDPMRVTRWDPPRCCRLEKTGRTVLGWAQIEILPGPGAGAEAGAGVGVGAGAAPGGTGGCVVRWQEELRVRGVPRALDPVTALAGRLVFGRALGRLLDG